MRRVPWLAIVGAAVGLWLAGCAGYSGYIVGPRNAIGRGEYDKAILELTKLVAKNDNDLLLYLMDLGVAQHMAGKYSDAIATFHKADKLAEITDYTSVTKEVGAVLLNDDIKVYKGEDFEKVLIHVYLALDYTLLGSWESALVECRRVNHVLDQMISKGKLPYENNAFAKYLAAALFEAQREYDDAFVDYRQLKKWGYEKYPYLGPTLLRLAGKLGNTQELEQFKKEYPEVQRWQVGKNEGEIVVLLEVGNAPIKVPSPQFRLAPMFQKNAYVANYGVVKAGAASATAHTLFDIESTAVRELNHKLPGIIAKKTAGIAAKEAAAYGVAKATDSKGWGFLTSLFLHATDHADTRSWTTLPARLQLARMTVPAGRQDVVLDLVTVYGSHVPAVRRWIGVDVKPGGIVFLHHRLRE